jgi:hypothetical protein
MHAAELKAHLRRRIQRARRSIWSCAPWIALALSILFATLYVCCDEGRWARHGMGACVSPAPSSILCAAPPRADPLLESRISRLDC